ncbi:MAG: division/cell wall cluster transcriptional repressor MraZ [Solirubrobacteraceae bacterium]
MIFLGRFEHSLDAKHRMTVPARFREAFANGAVLAKSPEAKAGTPRCLALWPAEDFERWVDLAVAPLNPLSPQAREIRRALLSNAHKIDLDSAYRVMIPADMLRYAGLDKEVALTGVGDSLEIWDRATQEAYNDDVLSRFTEITANLGKTA